MLEWKVWKYNYNTKKIEQYNALTGFENTIQRIRENCEGKEDFANQLDKEFMYQYWSRCQYEVLIKPWVGDEAVERKVDIYEQLKMNWDAVVGRCWYGC